MRHLDDCWGAHTSAVACEQAIALRAEWAKDPFHCHGATRSGYHSFTGSSSNDVCEYDGCERTLRELSDERT